MDAWADKQEKHIEIQEKRQNKRTRRGMRKRIEAKREERERRKRGEKKERERERGKKVPSK